MQSTQRTSFLHLVLVLALIVAVLPGLAVSPGMAWHPLNDTGILTCLNDRGSTVACDHRDALPGQDGHHGRDAAAAGGTLLKVGGGMDGFDFTKISNSGQELPATAGLGAGPQDWACTRDNVTGLIWEVKVDDSRHFRHAQHRYSWYYPNSPDGNPGDQGNTSTCGNTLDGNFCNTTNYVAKVNAGLCGFTDWRVPTLKEATSILHFSATARVDSIYLPHINLSSWPLWTSTPYAVNMLSAWTARGTEIRFQERRLQYYLLLVRG